MHEKQGKEMLGEQGREATIESVANPIRVSVCERVQEMSWNTS